MGFAPVVAKKGKEGVETALSEKPDFDSHQFSDAGDEWLGSKPNITRKP
jgi:hypothetical protein